MKRRVEPELLDSDSGTPREVADSLADLRMLNRIFGGVRSMAALIREVAERRKLKDLDWLDVAGGAGDVARLTTDTLSHDGVMVRPVVLDRAVSHMNGNRFNVCGDALALPFRNESFDVVGSSLFVHHLEPDEVARFLGEGLRVARHAFVINDLIRHPLHWGLAVAGRAIYRSRLTRHDGPASVRRAYTVDEIREILEHNSNAQISIKTFYLFRMGVIAWKAQAPQPAPGPSTI